MVKDLLQKGLGAITSKQTSIFSAAFFIVLTSAVAQLLGLLKYIFLGRVFGDSPQLGVYFAAFKIPDFIFQVFIASALTSALIPVFTDFLQEETKAQVNRFVSSLMTLATGFYIIVAIIVAIFALPLSHMLAPGFSPSELQLMANLTRIILISQIFFILGTIMTGMLQSLEHFILSGIAPALYNVGIIIGILTLAPLFGIYGAVLGVLIGSFFFCIVQLPLLLKAGYRFTLNLHINEKAKRVLELMFPRALTALVVQSTTLTNVFFISLISATSIVYFEFASTLMMAPVLLFGQSIAQASFPALAKKAKDPKDFLDVLVPSFNQILYLTLPISVLFIVLRIPIVRLVFGQSNEFSWESTVLTGMTLACFAISIAAQSIIYLLSRAFFAMKDTRTPFIITIVSVTINIILAYFFVMILKKEVYFVALAYSISTILSAILMTFFLNIHISIPKGPILISVAKTLIATLIMGFSLYIPIKLLDQLVFDTTHTINLIILTGISSFFGLLSFLFFTWLLEIQEAYYIIEVVRKFSSRTPILKNISEIIDGPRLNS
jgi:putative peptidoglycan lipid II flippase